MSTSADRMRRKRQRDAERAVIVAGGEQASQEKHESVTQRQERIERALGYAEWLRSTRPQLDPNASEQERRQFYGYTQSEQRPESERAEAAATMIEKSQAYLRDIATERETGDPHPRETGTIDC